MGYNYIIWSLLHPFKSAKFTKVVAKHNDFFRVLKGLSRLSGCFMCNKKMVVLEEGKVSGELLFHLHESHGLMPEDTQEILFGKTDCVDGKICQNQEKEKSETTL